ncbi:MAG: aminoacyl-tRNA hydrolase [Lachnospiraceae bacterium]|nr:aminoacyl-tRNA hydrolase [Lachnospiraceae bacterium]
MKAIFGLGNFGPKYAGTRHNMGFDTITRLSDKWGIPLDVKRFKGLCGFGWYKGEKVILVQPQTYMNNSGECVREICDFFKMTNKDIIVIYDDISLPPGQLRLRPKGSAGGHNGIKSVIAHLGSEEFDRVKIGVGEKPAEWDLADYVLSRFNKEDEPKIRDAIDRAAQAVESIISYGLEAAMGEFNRKAAPEKAEAE